MIRAIAIVLLLCGMARAQFAALPVVQVRGGAEWTPADMPGLDLWLDASDASTITETGGAVTEWADKSGQGHDAVQAGSDLTRPTTGAATQNGLNVLQFGSGDYLATTANSTNEMSLIVVAVVSAQGSPLGSAGASSSRCYLLGNGANVYISAAVGAILYSVQTTDVAWNVFRVAELAFNGSAVTLYSSGKQEYTGAQSGTGANTATLNVGAINNNGSPTLYCIGQIAEIIVVKGRIISASERTAVSAYLMAKWGITAP